MSVTNQQSKVSYAASGNSTYEIPFRFTANEHIELYVDDVKLEYGTDYIVTGENDENGGELTFLVDSPESGDIVILREIPLTQDASLNDGGPNSAATTESLFDKVILIAQQLNEKISRAIKMPVSSTLNPQMTGAVVPDAMLVVNEAGDALAMGPSYKTFSTDMDAKVTQAQEYANAAGTSADEASTSAQNALTSEENAATSEQAAAISETNASSSEANAAQSAILAQQAADSVLFNDVIFITSAMSPINIDDTYRGVMLACDCSGGPIVINLPLISNLDLSYPWTVSMKKTDTSGNSVTINRAGSNLIDAGTNKTLGAANSGVTLIPDADPSPDVWTSAEFGSSAGNMTANSFTGNGVQAAFTLSVAPGSKNNTQVYLGGVYQHKAGYSVSGTTLTFSEAPLSGVDIEVNIGTTLSVGTPSDATVTLAKLASDVLAMLVPTGTPLFNVSNDPIPGYVLGHNKTLGISSADYSGSAYYNLYAKIWSMGGLSLVAGDPFRISSAKGASALADWNAGKLITIDFETNEIHIRTKGAARLAGSYQADAIKAHGHRVAMGNGGAAQTGTSAANTGGVCGINGSPVYSSVIPGNSSVAIIESTGGTENNVKNTGLFVFFKY